MPTAVEDHSTVIRERIIKKLAIGLQAAADVLAEEYQRGLQANQSPPASRPGQIPHDAPNTGGTGNISRFIEGTVQLSDNTVNGIVGFAGNISRRDNYLLGWDQGVYGPARPWVIPLYLRAKPSMINAFRAASGAG